MLDRVDLNMDSLGALGYRVGNAGADTAARADASSALPEPGDRVHIDAVVERIVPFSLSQPDVPREQAGESVAAQRAAMQPYLGGSYELARETASLQHENPFRANAMEVKTVEQSTGAILSMWA